MKVSAGSEEVGSRFAMGVLFTQIAHVFTKPRLRNRARNSQRLTEEKLVRDIGEQVLHRFHANLP